MKRFFSLFLSLLLLLSLCACGSAKTEDKPSSQNAAPAPQSAAEGGATELVLKTLELQPFAPGITIRDMARSENTIIDRMKILRAVLYWEIQNGHTTNNPFARVSVGEDV